MNVTPLNNGRRLPEGQVDVEVVALLENVLAEAKRGEIVGLCFAGVRPNGNATFGYVGAERVAVLGAATVMVHEATASVIE